DAEIADYYGSHVADFTAPSTRRIRHVLVRTRVRALEVLRRLRAGVPFAAVARRYSRDRSTRRSGGVLTVSEGTRDQGFQRYAFSLRRGALVGPVHFGNGWQVLQALGPVEPGRVKPLVEVASEIREDLLRAKTANAMAQWLDDLKREYAGKVVYAQGFAPG